MEYQRVQRNISATRTINLDSKQEPTTAELFSLEGIYEGYVGKADAYWFLLLPSQQDSDAIKEVCSDAINNFELAIRVQDTDCNSHHHVTISRRLVSITGSATPTTHYWLRTSTEHLAMTTVETQADKAGNVGL